MSIIRADSIKNRVGDGAPDFPNGITVTGIVTATTLTRASSNAGLMYTKFQEVVVADTKSLIVSAGETLIVNLYQLS